MNNCLFCKIINKEIPSKTIYEDDLIKVFLDINPNTNGDMLIIPKKHYENILEIDENIITHCHKIIKNTLFPIIKEKLQATGLTIIQNNGTGQEVKHYHIHLTPRYENDDLKISANKDILLELDDIQTKLMK